MRKQEVWKTKTYRELLKHFMRVCREKRVVELALQEGKVTNGLLRAALEDRRAAMVFFKLA